MTQSPETTAPFQSADHPATPRVDGFTTQKRVRFLHALALCGNVSQVCGAVGVSPQTVYCARRRDPDFAKGWKAALVLAFDSAEQDLAARALQGVEEQVWFRGEVVGQRRKFDTRLFLAHFARLEQAAADKEAQVLAARFDETLACIAGETFDDDMAAADGRLLPLERKRFVKLCGGDDAAAADWDEWQARAFSTVDAAIAGEGAGGGEIECKSLAQPADFSLRTLSLSSTCSDKGLIN